MTLFIWILVCYLVNLTPVRYYDQLNNHRNFLIKISHKNLNIWWNFKMILQHLKMSLNISCNFKITWQHLFSSPCWALGNWEEPWLWPNFLDTQVSLAPTHVSPLVGWSVTLSDFQSLVSNGRSNQKIQKTKSIYFRILLLGGPSPPTKMYMKA